MPDSPVLEASELTKVYRMPRKGSNSLRQQTMKAVDNVSLQLFAGTTAPLVGQSAQQVHPRPTLSGRKR
jgi:ABC-type glutathione transport system ATPase component